MRSARCAKLLNLSKDLQRLFFFSSQAYKSTTMKKSLVICLAVLLFSCSKDTSCQECDTESGFVSATIIDNGPIETDGCGWVIKLGDEKFYHPDELAAEFRQNNLSVKICYESSKEEFRCGIAALTMPVLRIIAIKK